MANILPHRKRSKHSETSNSYSSASPVCFAEAPFDTTRLCWKRIRSDARVISRERPERRCTEKLASLPRLRRVEATRYTFQPINTVFIGLKFVESVGRLTQTADPNDCLTICSQSRTASLPVLLIKLQWNWYDLHLVSSLINTWHLPLKCFNPKDLYCSKPIWVVLDSGIAERKM